MRFPSAILIALLLLASATRAVWSQSDEFAELRNRLAARVPQISVGEIKRIPGTDFLEVQANNHELFYTNAEGSVAFFGALYDLTNGRNLTELRKQELMWVDYAALPLERAFTRVNGDGRQHIAVFTDPDCPYCKRLEGELAGIDNATIHYFLYPLSELHPDARRKAHAVWCAPDRAQAWEALMSGGVEAPLPATDCQDPLDEIATLAKRLGIRGTPGLVFGNGRLVPGWIPKEQIEKYLSEGARS